MNVEPNQLELTELDNHFAEFISRIGGGEESLITATAARLSQAVRQGHICLALGNVGTEPVYREKLLACNAIGSPEQERPLVLGKADRLYLRRYWLYEKRLAVMLLAKATESKAFQSKSHGTQAEAIARAIRRQLTIITGGPGTGKTTTVLEILRQLVQGAGGSALRIALAAPTGKAAGRLEETLRAGIDKFSAAPGVKEKIPTKASTIHRLLGSRHGSRSFWYNKKNPLPLDILVIDEASMVALPLMARLLDALLPTCRVILLGDRDQLASVEPGAVLADIVDAAATKNSPLSGSVVSLTENFRFKKDSGIQRCSSAVRAGAVDDVLQILREPDLQDLAGMILPERQEFQKNLAHAVTADFTEALKAFDPAGALKGFAKFRVLCALRHGPFGVSGLNRRIEECLALAGLIPSSSPQEYRGKPILITQNDYQLQLFNGDIGVVFPDPPDGSNEAKLWAWFVGPDGAPRKFSLARLPEHDVAYAMTVHKAQGSEFEKVLFILPDRDSPVLSRELIYTGVTRASQRVELWFNEEVLRQSISRQAIRVSGLRDALESLVTHA